MKLNQYLKHQLASRGLAALLSLGLAPFILTACGDDNLFSSVSSKPTGGDNAQKDEAISAINDKNWEAAEEQLEALLDAHPEDQEARSMLGNVLMKKSGIDTLSISKNVTEASDDKGTVNVSTMIQVLPEATDANVNNLKKSIDTFSAIPEADRTAPQKLQMAMAQFSYAMVLTKKVATDSSGSYDDTKAASMSPAAADDIIGMMDNSAATVASIGGDQNDKGSAKIAKTTDAIKTQEGDTSADKLRAYLAAQKK